MKAKQTKKPKPPKKKNRVVTALLSIPVTIVIDFGLLVLGALLDGKLFQGADGTGHPFPVFTLVCVVIAIAFTIVMLIGFVRNLMLASKEKNLPLKKK